MPGGTSLDYGKAFARDLFAGGLSAATSKTAMAPIERVKLLLQVQSVTPDIPEKKRYKGITDCFIRIPREQGVRSFWRGNLANVWRAFPSHALNFAIKNKLKFFYLSGVDKKTQFWRFFLGNVAAGGTAGAITIGVVYPLDMARTLLGVDVSNENNRKYKGVLDCLRRTVRSDGPIGVYRGFLVAVCGVTIYRGILFGLYDTAKGLQHDRKHTPFILSFFIAQTVSIVSSFASYPFDTVQRIMMVHSGRPPAEQKYTGNIDCFRRLVREDGPSALYKGNVANILRTFGGALVLVMYDEVKAFVCATWGGEGCEEED